MKGCCACDDAPWNGEPREMGEVWRLTKGAHLAVCRLRTHPYGGEVCLDVDDEMHRTQAGRAWQPLIDLGLEWKAQFQAKGWTS